MFGDLKAIVDVIRSAVESIKGFRDNSTRQNIALDLLRTYFLLMDIVKEGLELLNSVGMDPVATITSLPPKEAQVALQRTVRSFSKANPRFDFWRAKKGRFWPKLSPKRTMPIAIMTAHVPPSVGTIGLSTKNNFTNLRRFKDL